MQFYFREEKAELVQLYYPVTDKQLEFIANHQYKLFPPRFFTKPVLCPMLNREYAQRVASERTNWVHEKTDCIHVLRFLVKPDFIKQYTQGSITNDRARISIPQSDLSKLNQNIVGYIERVEKVDLIKDNIVID
jgi:hypothetical protein